MRENNIFHKMNIENRDDMIYLENFDRFNRKKKEDNYQRILAFSSFTVYYNMQKE